MFKKSTIKDRVLGNDFLKDVLSIGGGKLISQIISMFSIPILSRIFDPSVFGDQQIVVSAATIILSFVNLGLGSSIMAAEDENEAKELFVTSTVIMTAITALIISGIYFFNATDAILNVSKGNGYELLILAAYIVFFNLSTNLSILANRFGKNRLLLVNPIVNSVCNLAIAVPLGLLGFGYEGVMLASIVGLAIAVIQMGVRLRPIPATYSRLILVGNFKKYVNYIKFQSAAGLLGTASQQMPTQVLSRMFDNSTLVGNYSMCVNLVNYPISLIGNPISTAYFRKASTLYRQNGGLFDDVSDFSYSIVKRLLMLTTIPVCIYIWLGTPLVKFVLGDAWELAGEISVILIYPYVLGFCATCITYCRVSIGKQKVNLLISVIKVIITAGGFAFAAIAKFEFVQTVSVYAITLAIGHILDMGASFYIMKKNYIKYVKCVAISSTVCVSILIIQLISQ